MPVRVPYPKERGGQYAGLAYVDASADIAEVYGNTGFNMKAMLKAALLAGELEGNRMVRDFAAAMENVVRSSRNQLANVHHQVGETAKDEVVAAYRRVRAERAGPGSYRQGAGRDAGGRLLQALSSPEFFRGTYDGIGFANKTFLDGQARQWYRLNFGARASPGASNRIGPGLRSTPAPVTWQGLVLGVISLPTEPSKPFYLPPGYWKERGFYPAGKRAIFPTGGVRAWNFLDAGTAAIGRELGPAYQSLNADWLESAKRGVGPLSRVVNVSQPR